jgi:hypothetical protein
MFLGRMLYEVGSLDAWQVVAFLLGTANSGKSTVHNIIKIIYATEDVGIMSNNFQKTFGLADIYDKFVFIAPEIKKDWNIDQAEFQEIVSGGKVNVNVKHQPSITVEWKTTGMLAGNETPGFIDNSGSISRRIVVTRFDKKVTQSDPMLHKKLENEIDCILKKANIIYLKYVNEYGDHDLWQDVLPEYFLETQKMMCSASNSLHSYLESDLLRYGEELSVPYEDFFKRFNMYCTENNYPKQKINVDFYRSLFNKYDLTVTGKVSRRYMGKMYKNTTFIQGVDFQECEEIVN